MDYPSNQSNVCSDFYSFWIGDYSNVDFYFSGSALNVFCTHETFLHLPKVYLRFDTARVHCYLSTPPACLRQYPFVLIMDEP